MNTDPLKLDLGSGPTPAPGFVGVDLVAAACEDHCVVVHNLIDGSGPWPFADESVSELRCSHFIEHVPAHNVWVDRRGLSQDALLYFFDEAYRVAKTGAKLELVWPSLETHGQTALGILPDIFGPVFQDPTHRRFLPMSFLSYLDAGERNRLRVSHTHSLCNWKASGHRRRLLSDTRLCLQYEVTLEKAPPRV